MISVAEAHKIIQGRIRSPAAETVKVNDATGRVLAHEIVATFPQPRFDNTAMDGFAVRARDTIGASADLPVTLSMKGVIPAGSSADTVIGKGECCQIMTGAPMPEGADAVVMVEDSSGFGDSSSVDISREVVEKENIRYSGEEIAAGETLIHPGNRLSAGEIGVAATFGYGELEVYRRPNIALFATGDELIEPGEELKPGQIYNSNLHVFAELSERVGTLITMQRVLKDSRESLKDFLSEAIEKSNLIVSSGGVSMGKHDYVRDVFLELGVKEYFWKVAQKPGRPLFFGESGGTLIFGLPGNPVSSFTCFMEYVWPTCERFMGLTPINKVTARLLESFPQETEKRRYLLGHVEMDGREMVAKPSGKYGSHMFTSALMANAILESPRGEGPLKSGQEITVRLLPWSELQ